MFTNRHFCYVGNAVEECKLRLFQDAYFAGDLTDSKSTSRGMVCVFGDQTFVPCEFDVQKAVCSQSESVLGCWTEHGRISCSTIVGQSIGCSLRTIQATQQRLQTEAVEKILAIEIILQCSSKRSHQAPFFFITSGTRTQAHNIIIITIITG